MLTLCRTPLSSHTRLDFCVGPPSLHNCTLATHRPMSAVVHDHESITLQRGTPSSTRQYSPEYPKWVLAEQVLKAPHHSQLTALADSVKMLSDWIVHQPCSEEAWNTRLPNEEARPAPTRPRPSTAMHTSRGKPLHARCAWPCGTPRRQWRVSQLCCAVPLRLIGLEWPVARHFADGGCRGSTSGGCASSQAL